MSSFEILERLWRHRQTSGDMAARGQILHDPLGGSGLLQLLSPRRPVGDWRPDHRNAQCHPQPRQETFSYRTLLMDYMKSGAKWYSAPKPMLLDSLFDVDLTKPTPRNDEPAFDAANVLRFGQDLIYLVSATGNELGGHWLQTILGDKFRVHFLKDVYYGSHIDSTFVALRPGLILCNPARVNDDSLPEDLKQWKVIYSPPMENTDSSMPIIYPKHWQRLDRHECIQHQSELVVVDRDQPALINLLEKEGSM